MSLITKPKPLPTQSKFIYLESADPIGTQDDIDLLACLQKVKVPSIKLLDKIIYK